MRRKERIRRVGTILLAAGAGALGVMLGAGVYFMAPDLIPLPPTRTPAPPPPASPAPTATPAPVWAVTFEHRFSVGDFPNGRSSYELSVQCPAGGYSGRWQGEVTISGTAEVRRERVYLRSTGVFDAAFGGEAVTVVHPEQPLGAAATLQFPNLEAAEAARETCAVTVSLNGGPAQILEPGIPRELKGG